MTWTEPRSCDESDVAITTFREADSKTSGKGAENPTAPESPKKKDLSKKGRSGVKKEGGSSSEKAIVRLPSPLVEQAQKVGFDVSNYCENRLREGVAALKGAGPSEDPYTFNGGGSPDGDGDSGHRHKELTRLKGKTGDEVTEDFQDFCEVDLDLADSTIQRHLVVVRDFMEYFNDLIPPSKGKIRGYLKERKRNEAEATYANRIKALRRLIRDFMKKPHLIEGFKIPQPKTNNCGTSILNKESLQAYYKYIDLVKYEAIFLFKASSGLRTSEVTGLTVEDVDFEKRMVTPKHGSATKKSYVTFYNSEAGKKLQEFMPKRNGGDDRLFQTNARTVQKSFRRTSGRAGIEITPKVLREWFAKEMRNLNVSGEHIDAYCGRLPKTVRAKHYTDFSPERLKEVYEEADIRILD